MVNDWRDGDLDATRRLPLGPLPPPPAPGRPYGPPPYERPGGGTTVGARRRPRVLWIVLLVLVVLFVVVDRIAVWVAESQVVSRVQSSQELASKPKVHIGGFPFLTQVAVGQYPDVAATVRGLSTPGPRVERIIAHLKGVHVPLGDAVRNQVKRIPVDRASASVFVTYADLNAFLKNQPGSVQVQSDGNALKVTSGDFPASLSARITVENNSFTIIPTEVGFGGLDLPVPESVQDALKSPLPVALPNLPFNLRLASVKVHQNDLELAATADKLVLEPPQS